MKDEKDEKDDEGARDDQRDRALLRAISEQRDSQAMEAFYRRYQDRLIPFLTRFTTDQGLLQETYNDVMYKVWLKAHQYKGQAKVSTWVFSIGYRTCLRSIKKALRDSRDWSDAMENSGSEPAHASTPDGSEKIEQQDALRKALRRLSSDRRLVIELAYFQGMTTGEISTVIGRPVNTVKTRLHHARKQLRSSLGDYDAI